MLATSKHSLPSSTVRLIDQQVHFHHSHVVRSHQRSPAWHPQRQRLRATAALQTVTEDVSVISSASEPTWTAQDYASLWESHFHEESYAVESVEGTIPTDLEARHQPTAPRAGPTSASEMLLTGQSASPVHDTISDWERGTFYRTGPGIFELNGHPLHVFDGHGLVASIAIRDGRAWYRSRYVRTPVYMEEVEQRRGVQYRGFGTTKPGGWLANVLDIRDKPVANTALLEWDGKLWALWEAHRPFILDPETLETRGEDDLGGLLREAQPFCAHPQYDAASGRLVGFSLGLRHAEGKLHIYELELGGGVAVHKVVPFSMNPPLYVHDFAVTASWYIFYEAPLKVDFGKFATYLLGTSDQTKMVAFDRERSGRWMLVPRGREGDVVYVETPPQFIWHYANASEDPVSGDLTVDACVFDEFAPGDFELRDSSTIQKSTLRRTILSPSRGSSAIEELLPRSADLPIINDSFAGCSDYRFCWLAASSTPVSHFPYQSVVKVDVSRRQTAEWNAPDGCFVGEPLYVGRRQPAHAADAAENGIHAGASGQAHNGSSGQHQGPTTAPEEDDGYVVTLMHDARRGRSSLVILDARDPAAGPLAQLHLRRALPFAFHCLWSSQYHGPC